jgi:hypothetical protein
MPTYDYDNRLCMDQTMSTLQSSWLALRPIQRQLNETWLVREWATRQETLLSQQQRFESPAMLQDHSRCRWGLELARLGIHEIPGPCGQSTCTLFGTHVCKFAARNPHWQEVETGALDYITLASHGISSRRQVDQCRSSCEHLSRAVIWCRVDG